MPVADASSPDSATIKAAASWNTRSPQLQQRMDREYRERRLSLLIREVELELAILSARSRTGDDYQSICPPSNRSSSS